MKRLKIAQIKIAKMIRSTEFVARHNKTYTLSLFYTHKVTSPHRLETAIRNCVGKSQPYALTDDGPTAEQPQGAPIGRLAFPGLAKRARRGATRAPPGIKAYLVSVTACTVERFASLTQLRPSAFAR